MPKPPTRLTAVIAGTAAAAFSGAAIAGAATAGSSSTTTTPSAQQRPGDETALTGETKDKVEAAALARVPGTVIRTETDHGGAYESHIRKSDGTEVEVKVDKDFTVTAVEERPAGGRGGHGPGGRGAHADLAAVAQDLGVTEAQLRNAVAAARPDKADKGDRGADLAAAIAKDLGVSAADVEDVLDANRPDRSAGRPGRPDAPALAAALAKKFSVTEAKAQAAIEAARKAHDAEHEARETAMYAAIAKTLGKDADAVQKAFEAHEPARP